MMFQKAICENIINYIKSFLKGLWLKIILPIPLKELYPFLNSRDFVEPPSVLEPKLLEGMFEHRMDIDIFIKTTKCWNQLTKVMWSEVKRSVILKKISHYFVSIKQDFPISPNWSGKKFKKLKYLTKTLYLHDFLSSVNSCIIFKEVEYFRNVSICNGLPIHRALQT